MRRELPTLDEEDLRAHARSRSPAHAELRLGLRRLSLRSAHPGIGAAARDERRNHDARNKYPSKLLRAQSVDPGASSPADSLFSHDSKVGAIERDVARATTR